MVSTKSKNNLIKWLSNINNYKSNLDQTQIYPTYKLSKEYIAYYEKENNSVYIINIVELNKSNISSTYKTNLTKNINGKTFYAKISLDKILKGEITEITNKIIPYVDKKKNKITTNY
jgi:hypothetical protein